MAFRIASALVMSDWRRSSLISIPLMRRDVDNVLIARSPKGPKKKGSPSSKLSSQDTSTTAAGSPGSIASSPETGGTSSRINTSPGTGASSSRTNVSPTQRTRGQSRPASGSQRGNRQVRPSSPPTARNPPFPAVVGFLADSSAPYGKWRMEQTPPAKHDYEDWLLNQRRIETYIDSFGPSNRPPQMGDIEAAKVAKEKARQSRRTADQSRRVATGLSNLQGPTTRAVMKAMVKSNADSKASLMDMEAHIGVQSNAMVQSLGTTHHNNAAGLSHAASRQAARSRSREAHNDAFVDEYGARFAKAIADGKRPGSPTRDAAYKDAVDMTRLAQRRAQRYYAYHDEYRRTIDQEYTSGSSSSDEEWTLRDNPRSKRG